MKLYRYQNTFFEGPYEHYYGLFSSPRIPKKIQNVLNDLDTKFGIPLYERPESEVGMRSAFTNKKAIASIVSKEQHDILNKYGFNLISFEICDSLVVVFDKIESGFYLITDTGNGYGITMKQVKIIKYPT